MRIRPRLIVSLLLVIPVVLAPGAEPPVTEELATRLSERGAIAVGFTSFPEETAEVHWLRPDGTAVLLSNDALSFWSGPDVYPLRMTPADARASETVYSFTPTPGGSTIQEEAALYVVGDRRWPLSFLTSERSYAGRYLRSGVIFHVGGATTVQRNFSSRAWIDAEKPAIGGLILDQGRWTLVRVVGPSLARFGIDDACAEPLMEIHSGDDPQGLRVVKGWRQAAEGISQLAVVADMVGAFPLESGSADCALLVYLGPGSHTLVARPAEEALPGTVLLEAYYLPFEE